MQNKRAIGSRHQRFSPPPSAKFAVVLNPGTLFQQVDVYCSTLQNAENWARETREPGLEVDVMKVMPNGTLTTEF